MERVIFFSRIKSQIAFKSLVKRTTLWIAATLIGFHFIYLFFLSTQIEYISSKNLDARIEHELFRIKNAFSVEQDSLIILDNFDLNEPDLLDITDNPFFLQVFNKEGDNVYQSENLKYFTNIPYPLKSDYSNIEFVDLELETDNLRTGYTNIFSADSSQRFIIQLSSFNNAVDSFTENILYFNLLSLPIIVGLIVIISLVVAKKSFDPISRIISLAQEISAKNLSQRIVYKIDPDDKLKTLIDTLNNLFDRLEFQVQQISEFSDNASHQLMSPLTAIYTELEFILKQDHEINDYKNTLGILKEQTERMIQIVKTLLILAKERGEFKVQTSIFNLNKLLTDKIQPMINSELVDIKIDSMIYLRGNQDYFAMSIQNLINNAQKYSPDGSKVFLNVHKKSDGVVIVQVKDSGTGIPDDEKEKIFNKFYRGKKATISSKTGFGLGLSLANGIVNSMGGTIKAKDNKPTGTIFEISLQSLTLE